MGFKTGETIAVDFCTQTPSTGAATNADSTPTGTLVINGTDNGATVTVTNKSTGNYKASVVLPAVTDGDVLTLRISAVMSGVTGKAVIWAGEGTLQFESDTYTRIGAAGASLTALGDTRIAHLDADVSSRLATSGYTVPPTAAANATAVAAQITTDHGAGSYATATGFAVPGSAMTLTSAYDFAKGTAAMVESYAANGVAMTPAQALFAIHQYLMDFGIGGTSYTVKKLDNSATAFIVTLNDATNPTGAART